MLVAKNAEKWGKKVRIIGIEFGESKEKALAHVEKKRWTDVEHYHHNGSYCGAFYNINSYPNIIIVDTNGKIVFKGNPAVRKSLETDLDTLQRG